MTSDWTSIDAKPGSGSPTGAIAPSSCAGFSLSRASQAFVGPKNKNNSMSATESETKGGDGALRRQLERERRAQELFERASGGDGRMPWGERLAAAVIRGNAEGVSQLLAEQPSEGALDALDAEGQTALHWAALYNEAGIAWQLLKAGAAPSTPNSKGASALHQAVLGCSHAAVRLLLAADPLQALSANRWSETPLHLAAQVGDPLSVLLLLRCGAPLLAPDQWARTPSQVAADHGQAPLDRLFAALAALPDGDRSSAAARWLLLLEGTGELRLDSADVVGAELEPDHENRGDEEERAAGEKNEVERSSVEAPAKVMAKMMEAPLDEERFVELLRRSQLEEGSPGHLRLDVVSADMYGLTPMHKLASWDRPHALQRLLEHPLVGQSPSSEFARVFCTPRGETPLLLALEMGALRCSHLLLDQAHLLPHIATFPDRSGTTPLIRAAQLACSGASFDPDSALDLVLRISAFEPLPLEALRVACRCRVTPGASPHAERVFALLSTRVTPQQLDEITASVYEHMQAEEVAAKALKQAAAAAAPRRRLDMAKFGSILGGNMPR